MAITHAIGNPENESERRAIAHFSDTLPGSEYVIFHNLELVTRAGLPYEYDIIIVGEFAVYVVEVKGYQGKIKGNASEWEFMSGATLRSPIPLNNKKAKVVAGRIQKFSPLLSSVWVQPLIVFSDPNVRINIKDDQSRNVLKLDEATEFILGRNRLPIQERSITRYTDMICDAIFQQFTPLRRKNEIGEYQIIETVDRNELYTTYLAKHLSISTEARYFIKVYSFDIYSNPTTQQKYREWILRDANALHRIGEHANIVRAHPPFSWENNKVVLPIAWVDGYSLRGLLDERKVIPYSRKIDYARQLSGGLLYAHSKGVIHRDIRPENVVISSEGSAIWTNFDCARIEGDDLKTIATSIGRYLDERYIAPEMWNDPSQASILSDQYSLGVLMYELFCGHPPYVSISTMFENQNLPVLPSEANSDLPPEIDEIIGKMCAFDPLQRYDDLTEVVDDLNIISL